MVQILAINHMSWNNGQAMAVEEGGIDRIRRITFTLQAIMEPLGQDVMGLVSHETHVTVDGYNPQSS